MSMPAPGAPPFPWACQRGFITSTFLAACASVWPQADWCGWVDYNGDRGHRRKRASDDRATLPEPLAEGLYRLARWDPGSGLGSVLTAEPLPDLSLWGAGLHEVRPGGHVRCHLDADHHPRLGLQRVLSLTLYVHPEWHPNWGGELELYASKDGPPVERILPEPGLLVALDVRGAAWHAVAPVIGPVPRRSLAVFFYGAPVTERLRPRAVFAAVEDSR